MSLSLFSAGELMSILSGKCLCGAVKYKTSAPPAFAANCHCVDCQKTTGSGYAPSVFIAEEAIEISGQVKFFDSRGKSGKLVHRGFCPECGSQLFHKPEAMAGIIGVRAGSLDDLSQHHPQMNVFTKNAPKWDIMDSNIPHFAEMPPQE